MAKSLRSKWRRKCRAVKRVRYGKIELEKLKQILETDGSHKDVEMSDISEIATVVDSKTINNKLNVKSTEMKGNNDSDDVMDVDNNKRTYSNRTMKDQYGNYPIWMNKRRIMALKHKKGRGKNIKSTVKTHKRLTRKQKKKFNKSK